MEQSAVVALQMLVDQADEDLREIEGSSASRMAAFERRIEHCRIDAELRKERKREAWRMFRTPGSLGVK